MRDSYTPQPVSTALCPHCGATVDGAPSEWSDLILVTLRWRCPRCHRVWQETREPQSVLRYWDGASCEAVS